MQKKQINLFLACGLLIFPWLVFGVFYAGSLIPGFDHANQFMSELGANGSVTERFSPKLNNYPVGILFIAFGYGIFKNYHSYKLRHLASMLFILHGFGSIGAGFFSCDLGCPIVGGSLEQNLHTLSGILMFGSLSLACLLWSFPSFELSDNPVFSKYSFACFLAASVCLLISLLAYWFGSYAGFFERLSYGILCTWLFVLSIKLIFVSDVIER